MDFNDLKTNWDAMGRDDPLFAIASWAEKKGNKWDLEEFLQTGLDEIEQVVACLERLGVPAAARQGRALDFGCGVGRLTQALALHFDSVTGVDIAASMIDMAREINRHGEKCKYVLNDTNNLSQFSDASFDFIYSNITLQHMEPRYARVYIREFVRLLDTSGVLLFQLPDQRVQAQAVEEAAGSFFDSVKGLLKKILPDFVMGLLRKVLGRDAQQPMMEMHAIARAEVGALLEELGIELIDVSQNQSAGPSWISFRYCAMKR